ALHAQGDHGAARDRAGDLTRAAPARGGERASERPEPRPRGLWRDPAHRDRGVRNVVARGVGGTRPDRGADGNPRAGGVRIGVPLPAAARGTGGGGAGGGGFGVGGGGGEAGSAARGGGRGGGG